MLLHDRRRLREDELWDLMYAFGGGGFGPPVDLGEPVSLLTPGFIHGAFNVQRVQASGAMATALNADGVTWREVAADTARFHGTAQRLLLEGARTNSVTNPRAEGAVAGIPGTWPTGWVSAPDAVEIVGTGIENGINYIDIGFSGTGTTRAFTFGSSPAAAGQGWCCSQFVKLISGSLAGVTLQSNMLFGTNPDGSGTVLLNSTISFVPGAGALGSQRHVNANAAAPASTGGVAHRIRWSATGAYAFVLRFGWPQLELGGFISSPILPAVGVPAASTRGRDNINATLTALNIPESAKGTLVFTSAMFVTAIAAAGTRTMVDFNDNTVGNRITAGVSAASANIVGSRVSSGSPMATGVVGTFSTAPSHVAMAIDGLGNARYSVNGSLMQAVTSAQTSSLLSLRLGDDPGAVTPLFGEIGSLVWYPGVGTEAHLQTLSTAGVHWFFAVSPGRLASPFAVTRTQAAGAMATRQLADGTWAEMAANTARFHDVAQRLLVEGARTNSHPNPRGEGAVVVPGARGTPPTGWTVTIGGGGDADYEIVAAVAHNGLTGIRVKLKGTPATNGNFQISFNTSTSIAVVAGEVWTSTAFYRAAVPITGLSNYRHRTRTTGNVNNVETVLTPTPDATQRRYGHTLTCAVGALNIYSDFTPVVTAGVALSGELEIYAPQIEKGEFASTPILPAVGVPAAATRGADVISAPLASLGLAASGASTTAMKLVRTTLVAGANQTGLTLSDGTNANRIYWRGSNGAATSVAGRVIASVGANTASLGSAAAGVVFKAGLRVDGVGNVSGYVASLLSVAGAPVAGLTALHVGSSAGGEVLWGEIERLSITPTVMSDAEFQAAVDAQA